MLDIPTARTKLQARRTAQQSPDTTGGLGTQPESSAITPQTAGPGMTSLDTAAPTAYAGTTPYEYAGQGWNDPVAQSVMKDYWSGPQWEGAYDTNMQTAQAYNDNPGVLRTPLDPSTWGTVYQGQDYADITNKYKEAGGTYFDQFTPAQQAGVPYYAATGEAAPVMNMQTGVAENPLTKQPMQVGGTGSQHSIAPDVMNKMWR